MTVLRHLLSILLLPVMMAGVVPRWLRAGYSAWDTHWPNGSPVAWLGRIAGVLLLLAGCAMFVWCVSLFARIGRGTLAPWDPTQKLVIVGPYRVVRNPMISGVLAVLLGQSLLLGSRVTALWTLAFFVMNQTYFVLHEEPGLESRFGDEYREYKSRVPRWIPGFRATQPARRPT